MAQEISPTEAFVAEKARKNLTWFMLFSVSMFFAALLSAYVVSRGSVEYWVRFSLPEEFWWSTGLIALGSLTVQWALVAVRKGAMQTVRIALFATLLSGIAFTATQFAGWNALFERGYALNARLADIKGTYGKDYMIGKLVDNAGQVVDLVQENGNFYRADDTQRARSLNAEMDEYKNTASSYFYVLTYAHWAHVLGGLLALLIMAIRSAMGQYSAERHVGLWAGVVYWHFLAGTWVVILSFLAIVH